MLHHFRSRILALASLFFILGCGDHQGSTETARSADTNPPPNLCFMEPKLLELVKKRAHVALWEAESDGGDFTRYVVLGDDERCIYSFDHFRTFSDDGTEMFKTPRLFQLRDLTGPPEYFKLKEIGFRRFARSDSLARRVVLNLQSSCESQSLTNPKCMKRIQDWVHDNVVQLSFFGRNGEVGIDVVASDLFFNGGLVSGGL